jgi:hypothetical protein
VPRRNIPEIYPNFGRTPEEMRLSGRPRRRWENKIKMNHKRICRKDVDWFELVQYSTVATSLKRGK